MRLHQALKVVPVQPVIRYGNRVAPVIKDHLNVNEVQGGCEGLQSKV